MLRNREAAQDGIAELMTAHEPRRRHHPSHAERRADFFRVARPVRASADHFLEGDDVGVDRAEDRRNPPGTRPAVESTAPVNVVSDDAERRRRVTHYVMIVVAMRSAIPPVRTALLAAVVVAGGCAERPTDPLQLDRNILTVDNRTSENWTNVEIWLNSYFRITVASIPAKSRFQAPLDTFVAGFGQRFNFHRMQVKDLRLIAKLPDGRPLELKKQFEASGLAGAFGGVGGKR